MNIGKDIKEIRLKSLLSQEAFANALGVSFTTVNRWETGRSIPSYRAMKMIDDFCKENDIDYKIGDVIFDGKAEHN